MIFDHGSLNNNKKVFKDMNNKNITPISRRGMITGALLSAGALALLPTTLNARAEGDDYSTMRFFSDVPSTLEGAAAINFMASKAIMAGYPNGTFRPNISTNRDTIMVFLYRLLNAPAFRPPKASPFVDVGTNNVFYKEISWGYENGVTEGWTTSRGLEFRPLQPVKRDAMAAFLMRASEDKEPAAAKTFSDVDVTQPHAAAMTWMNTVLGVGTKGGAYRPLDNATRKEVAEFLFSYVHKF